MNDVKIINDPVLGFIKIPRGLLYGIVEHPLFQRLNRISQLGLASVVYPGARHIQFQHSLGAFHLMSEAVLSLTTQILRPMAGQERVYFLVLAVDEILRRQVVDLCYFPKYFVLR